MLKLKADQSATIIFPPLTNQLGWFKKAKSKLQITNYKLLDCKLLPELSLDIFKNEMEKFLTLNFKILTLVDADILFPLGTPPFLYLQHLKEQRPKLSFIFLINTNLLTERLYQRFLKIPILFEKIIYVPLGPNNLPFKTKLQAKNFFLSLNENQRLILRLLVRGQSIPSQLQADQEYLEKLNIVKKYYGKWKLASPLLTQAALEIAKATHEPLSLKNNRIYVDKQDITDQFSPSQKKIIMLLLRARGKTIRRSRIARELWGKNYLEKYSDWAIDQMISKLRKKLTRLWINPEILVVKKRKGIKCC